MVQKDRFVVFSKALKIAFWALCIAPCALAQTAMVAGGGHTSSSQFGTLSVTLGETIAGDYIGAGTSSRAGIQQPFELLNFLPVVKVQLRYKNTQSSALAGVVVQLKDSLNRLIGSGVTDAQGEVPLGSVREGSYALQFQDNRAWAGVNGTDALLINRAYVGTMPLAGLFAQAAEVSGNRLLNSADAMLVMRRVAGSLNGFATSDWRYLPDQVQVQPLAVASVQTFLSEGLFAGDVNASYVPGASQRAAWSNLHENGVMRSKDSEYTLPLSLLQATDLGAATLSLDLPAGLEVTGVHCLQKTDQEGPLVYHQEGQRLQVIWYGYESWEVKAGDPVFELKVKGVANGMVRLDQTASELADSWGAAHQDWTMSTLRLSEQPLPSWSLVAYPNPVGDRLQIQAHGQVGDLSELWVTDATGRRVWSASEVIGGDGMFQWNLETAAWAAGVYHLESTFKSAIEGLAPLTHREMLSIVKMP